MARTQTVTVSCDLCGYGGPYTRPEDFTQAGPFGDVDLCRWCSQDPEPLVRMSCGRHDITIADDWTWSCSCGQTDKSWPSTHIRLVTPLRVTTAVPNLRYALARIHSETP